MGGPWFTVQEKSEEWQEIATTLVSDGTHNWRARVELRLALGGPTAATVNGPLVAKEE